MNVVKICWSGGKDSTAAVILHLQAGHKCKLVNYIPMFDNETPLLTNEHLEFLNQAKARFAERGCEIYTVSGMTYKDYFYKRSTRGKFKGRMFCFPCPLTGKCGFSKASKVKALNSVDIGPYDYVDVGIACDEYERRLQLNTVKRSILCEKGYREIDAYRLCELHNLLSPHYINNTRDGCALCPNAKPKERERWFRENPHVVDDILEMQEITKIEKPCAYPLRNHKWFIEE